MATRDLSTAVSGSIEDDVIYPFFAIELLFDDSPLRLWTGQGTLTFDGQEWTGTGVLLTVSNIEETAEISARGATLTLSGVNSEIISLALQEPYQGRVCNIYFGMFARGNLLQESGDFLLLESGEKILLENRETGLTSIFSGYMDQLNIEEGPDTSTVEMRVENRLIDLERQRTRRYTNADQKNRFPGDRGLEFVESIQDRKLVWGRSG